MRRTVDRLFHQTQRHQTPPVRSDALIAPTHGRFDGAVRRARPARISQDPSARIRWLKWALAGSTALIALALVLAGPLQAQSMGGDGGGLSGDPGGAGGTLENPQGGNGTLRSGGGGGGPGGGAVPLW